MTFRKKETPMALKENKETLTNGKNTTIIKNEPKDKENTRGDHSERQIIYEPLLTVDELSVHRKRKPALALPNDNLRLLDGSLKHLTSEYQRCFKKFERGLAPIISKRPKRSTTLFKLESENEFHSEYERSYGQVTERLYRPQLIKRCTNLKLEGDFYHVTDYRENFATFLLEKKVQLQRKATTLQMLGQMNLETENRRNFVLYQNVFRPPLCKKLTNLHLSGSLHMDTENRDKFLKYNVKKQHPLTRMPTNLHLEGTFVLQPEYTSAFVEYKNYEKQKPALPVDNIKSPIDFIVDSESSEKIHHPLIPHLRSYLYPPLDNPRRSSFKSVSRPNSRPPSGNSERFLEAELDIPPKTDKQAYGSPTATINKNGEPKMNISKSDGNFSRWSRTKSRTSGISQKPSPLRHFSKEENARSFAKSMPTLHRNNWLSRSYIDGSEFQRHKPASPGYQGPFECQPEYRKAYLNYITRERLYDPNERTASPWKHISNKEHALQALPPTYKPQIRSRKSSPNLSAHSQKSLEKIEKAAFGRRCRNSSMSEMSSSDDAFMLTAKKSQIPIWSKMPTRIKTYVPQEESELEPAFLLM